MIEEAPAPAARGDDDRNRKRDQRCKAQFQLVDDGGDAVEPSSVLVSGKGVSTATFLTFDEGLENPRIEWKRKGDDRVQAASVIVSTSGEPD